MFSKIAHGIVWTALTVVVLVLLYNNTVWFRPAADQAMESILSVTGKVPSARSSKASIKDKMNNARSMFSEGNIDGAVAIYNECIASNAKDPDPRGELGNVYYASGRLPEAAQAYYDAAKLLLDRNELERVDALLPIIAGINPAMGDELTQKLRTAMGVKTAPRQEPFVMPRAPQSALTRY